MKKVYIMVVLLAQIVFLLQITQIVDEDIQNELSRQSVDLKSNPDAFILTINKNNLEYDFKFILNVAEEYDVNIMTRKFDEDVANYVYFVYGSEFNVRNFPVVGDRLDFTKNEGKYYTTDTNDEEGVLVPTYYKLPLSSNAHGEIMPSATEWHAFESFINEGAAENLDYIEIFYYGFPGNISGFESRIQENEMISIGVETDVSYGIDSSKSVYVKCSLMLVVITFSYLISRYESSKKKYSILKLNGYSNSQILFGETLPMLLTIVVISVVICSSLIFMKYSYSLWLVQTAILCLIEILSIFAGIYMILTSLLYISIMKDESIFSLNNSANPRLISTVNNMVKVLLLMAFLPSVLTNFTSFLEYSKEFLRLQFTETRIKEFATISNEYQSMPVELTHFSNEEKKDIRNTLDTLGGIYFDASFNKELEMLQIPKESKEDLDSIYIEFPRNVFETKLVVVNERYLKEFPLRFSRVIEEELDAVQNTILVPESLEQDLMGVQNNYCSGSCIVKVVPDFTLTNLEVETIPFKKKLKNTMVLILGDQVDVRSKNREVDTAEFGTPFYRKFYFFEGSVEKVSNYLDEINQEDGEIRVVYNRDFLDEKYLEVEWWLNKLIPELVVVGLLVLVLNLQSTISYFDVEGKRISIEQAHGYRRLQSCSLYICRQLILYILPLVYISSGLFEKIEFNSLYSNRISIEAYFIVFGLFILTDFSVLLIMWHKVHKKNIDTMKGDS